MIESQEAGSRYAATINDICAEEESRGDFSFGIDSVHNRLKTMADESPEDQILQALVIACAYCLRPVDSQDPLSHGPFGPMSEIPEGDAVRVYPKPLGQVDEDALGIWAECAAEESLHPLVRSRLADLLWVRGHDGQGRWFQVAIEAYTELAATEVVVVERELGLARAVDICKESGHRHLVSAPLEALRGVVVRSLEASGSQFGVVARALDVLVGNGHPCSELLEEATERYGGDPNDRSDMLGIAERAAPDEDERMRLRRERISVLEQAGVRTTGLQRVSHLDDARTLALQAGLAEEVGRLTVMIEQTDTASEMQTFSQSVEVDSDEFRQLVDAVVGDDSPQSALLRFGSWLPIRDLDETRAFLDEIASQSVWQSLVTTVQYGPENSMARIPAGDPLRSDIQLGNYNAIEIQMNAGIAGKMVLDAVREKYDPQPQELADCFACEAIPPAIARRIAVSYDRWAVGDYVSAVSVIALTLELIVRRVCRQAGIHVTRTGCSGLSAPGVRTLGQLIGDLQPLIGQTATRYLQASLVDQWSLNLRNKLAHVLVEELDETQYVVLFHLACMLGYTSGELARQAE